MGISTAEQKIIYAAYMQYASYNKNSDADLKSPIKVKKLKDEVQTKQNRFLLSWHSDRITSVEKDRLVTQSKLLFVKYCKLRAAGGINRLGKF